MFFTRLFLLVLRSRALHNSRKLPASQRLAWIGMSEARVVEIPARDGFTLRGSEYGCNAAEQIVIVSSATAVPRRFYRHFAGALVDAGFGVLTYDYRGIGESRPRSLRGFGARMRDWGLLDMAGVIDWAKDRYPQASLSMVGHSVGGQVAGLLDNADALAGMVTFSSQSGHWRLQGGEQKLAVALHMHLSFPLLAKTFGYIPWSRFGGAEDLPRGVALEWARWCRDRRYLLGDPTLPLERYAAFEAPVLAYSFDDDKWGTEQAVDAMMQAYPNLERRHVTPASAGLPALGHFGFFRPDASALWPEVITWLQGRASMESRSAQPA